MSTHNRCLTKSRFQLGMQCPSKLFYAGKASEYANSSVEDSFLAALADGGFQVGALAREYFSNGHMIDALDDETSLTQAESLLKYKDVVIFEATFRAANLLVRTDILVKKGNRLDLIEVKSKSYDETKDAGLINSKGEIASTWKPYVMDVAFQRYVLTQACPQFQVHSWMMLPDKKAISSSDGLNQKFEIVVDENDDRIRVVNVTPLRDAEREHPMLTRIDVNALCDQIELDSLGVDFGPDDFAERVDWLASHYEQGEKIVTSIGSHCKDCEYHATLEDRKAGLKCGFRECWQQALGWSDTDFDDPTILELWDFRKKDALLADKRAKLVDVTEQDIRPQPDARPGLSRKERQWLQVEKVQARDDSTWIDTAGLRREVDSWKYPLHFIDFETSRVAIPFHRNRRPYEMIAFQFSHHVMDQDGNVQHKTEFLDTEPTSFPNFEFVRQLRKALKKDQGSVFCYSSHENSTLSAIQRQLQNSELTEVSDRDELINFIQAFQEEEMIDLFKLVKRYYYSPQMKGSNSLKAVLPALLNESEFLRQKYAQPIYGAEDGITSLNFEDKTWIKFEDGQVVDPYQQLPNLFADVSNRELERLSELSDGGAAMIAYAKLQSERLSPEERQEIKAALLRYCELDTLAMVMMCEAWIDAIHST